MRKPIYKEELKKVLIRVDFTCDKCGSNDYGKDSSYDNFDFNFIIRTGKSFPEGGSGEDYKLDLCKKCSIGLIDLLKNNGYKVYTEDWD